MMILAEQWHRDTVTAKLSQDSLRKLHFTAVNVSEKCSLFLFIGLLAYIVGLHNEAFSPFLFGLAFRTKGCKYDVTMIRC